MLGIPGGVEWLIILFIVCPAFVVPVVLFWFIFKKAGLPEPMALVGLVPGLGPLILLVVLAFARWPAAEGDGRPGAAG